jgi:4-amino-4-deoxy-L-arabinose transferase-like glycosyltransferase
MQKPNNFTLGFSIAILSAITLFFNLSKGEVQPWDEGLYAYRAKSIIDYNCWLDQTQYTLGGLYSSTYPPLVPWAIALNFKVWGINLFSIRVFSVICSIILLTSLTFFFSRQYSQQLVFLLTTNLLISQHWILYSRQGTTDVPLICFIVLSLILGIKFIESQRKSESMMFGSAFALTIFLALMTKIVLSYLPIILFIPLVILKEKKKLLSLGTYFLIGVLLALPWYIQMYLKYGWDFLAALFPPHLYSAVEGNVRPLGIFYYLNQLIVSNPIVIFGFFSLARNFHRFNLKKLIADKGWVYSIFYIWALFGILIFSLAPTKLPHYTLYMLLPLIILSLDFIDLELSKIFSKQKAIAFCIYAIGLFWSISPNFRRQIASGSLEQILPLNYILIGIFIILGLIALLTKEKQVHQWLSKFSFDLSLFFATIVLILLVILNSSLKPTGNIFGGEKTANWLLSNKTEIFVYLYHQYTDNNSDTLNPQLAWYTKGIYFGNDTSKKIIFIPISKKNIGLKQAKATTRYPQYPLVYYIANKDLSTTILIHEIGRYRPILLSTPNYIVFGRMFRKPITFIYDEREI